MSDIDDGWLHFCKMEIAEALSEGEDRKAVMERYDSMIQNKYPTYTSSKSLAGHLLSSTEYKVQTVGLLAAIEYFREIAEMDRQVKITTITDSPNSNNTTNNFTFNFTLAPKPKKREVKHETLNFRFIKDNELSLNDRLIYSFLRKWAYANTRRIGEKKQPRPLSLHRLRKHTGLRPKTIVASLRKLQQREYIDTNREPIHPEDDHRQMRYRHIKFEKYTRNLRQTVFGLIMAAEKHVNSGWARKALGISRATFFRMMQKPIGNG